MKKLFVAVLAIAALAACNKEEAPIFDSSKKSVSISIENLASETKHLTDAHDASDLVCATDATLTIVFTDGGNLIKSATLANADEHTAGTNVYTFHALPESVDGFYVIGSKRAVLTTIPATEAAAEEAWKADQEAKEWADIVVYGVNDTWEKQADPCTYGGHEYTLYKGNVTVKPWKARVEVSAITCDDLGDKNRDDDLLSLGYETVTVTDFGLAGTTFQTLTADNVMTANDDPAAAVKQLTPATGKVWSWNIEPGATANYLLTLNATVDAKPYYEVSSADRTITATKYQAAGADLAEFEGGKIYKMTIPFSESDLDDNSSLICVEATVTIVDWQVVEDVKPIF